MVNLRTPKGTIDLNPGQSVAQDEVISKILRIFKSHNGIPINTPTFELREILLNKYGDDSKLIYNLEDQGGDICSLRYDLTVPFARYLATNRISKLRKYQIGNVFRRDNPSFKTGRLREFVQADFDICGDNIVMANDSEILKMIDDILKQIELKNQKNEKYKYEIKINDRRFIMGLLELAGIPEKIHGSICSTIDKADKLITDELENEFKAKGLNDEQIFKINEFICFKGTNEEILEFLKNKINSYDSDNISNEIDTKLSLKKNNIRESFIKAIDEFYSLFKYISIYNIETIRIDLSLARGLDYYTGLIIEACYLNCEVGSVIGGGRYDNLCKSISTFTVPCVGFSVGVSRICALYQPIKISYDVFVSSGYGLMLEDRMSILNMLWQLNYKAETFTGKRVNFKDQIEYAKRNNFKYMLITGENESKNDIFGIMNLADGMKTEIKREDLKKYLADHI